MEYKIAKAEDVKGVQKLQEKNLVANLSVEESKNGFVTTPFTESQIETVVNENSLFVASHNNEIVAYAFAGSWLFFEQWPIFPYMTSRFTMPKYKEWGITVSNSFQYGPICIDHKLRGKGLIYPLFETLRKELVKKYPLSATFINSINERSLQAHTKKLGWISIDQFQFNNKNYHTLIYDMSCSVKY